MRQQVLFLVMALGCSLCAVGSTQESTKPVGSVKYVAKNAVRIRFSSGTTESKLPDWIYVRHDEESRPEIAATIEGDGVTVRDQAGNTVFHASRHQLEAGVATLAFDSPKDECLYGLGQFQDGYSNVRGLSRRLTQVNTQISIPMLLSSKGYGILWNNYGLTEFNPCSQSVRLTKRAGAAGREEVNVTSTEGGKREVRERHIFEGEITVAEAGDYALLLDVGQKMARRHVEWQANLVHPFH